MSKQQSKKFYQINKQPIELFFKDSTYDFDSSLKKKSQYFLFERNIFLISFLLLISTTVYINKAFIRHYNIKVIILVLIYLSRRFFKQIWINYHIKTYTAIQSYSILISMLIIQLSFNITYIIWRLLCEYTLISLCPLLLGLLVQIVVFRKSRYENIHKEFEFIIKKIVYVSIEIIYYTIAIPIYYSAQHFHYYSYYGIIAYSLFVFGLLMVYISSFNYLNKCADYHFYAIANGNWKAIQRKEISIERFPKVKQWIFKQNYERDSIVEHKGKYYIAKEEKNTVEPNNSYSNIFYVSLYNNIV